MYVCMFCKCIAACRLSPIGVASILAKQIVLMDDIATAARQLGLYCATVVIGLAIHFFIVLPLFCLFFAKRNPFVFMKHMADAILTAFGTASRFAFMYMYTYTCTSVAHKIHNILRSTVRQPSPSPCAASS